MKQRRYTPIPLALHYVKAALPAVPVLGDLPPLRRHETVSPGFIFTRSAVGVKPNHLNRYRQICGFKPSDSVPVTYLHLGAFTMHMAMMNHTSFPFAPLGLIHVRNSITHYRPIATTELWDLQVWAENIRLHPHGQLIDLRTAAVISGETVWEETTTLLHRSPGGGTELPELDFELVEPGKLRWDLPENLGRKYGAISGDRNPVHLYPITARAFGFNAAIAHGMWTKAKSLASFGSRLPESFRVDVEFKKPIFLPSTVVANINGENFAVHSLGGEHLHLLGKITPLES